MQRKTISGFFVVPPEIRCAPFEVACAAAAKQENPAIGYKAVKLMPYPVCAPVDESMVDIFLFDLDGTVTREEILPLIAKEFGVSDEIDDLTAKTIRGDFPFEASLRERVAILSRFPVSQVNSVVASVTLDAEVLGFLNEQRHRSVIVTGNLDVWLSELSLRLPVPIYSSTALVKADKIERISRVMDKRIEAMRFRERSVCAIGEGHNDLGMFENSRISVAYGGVHPPARSLLDVATHMICDPGILCRFLSQL